MSELFYESIQRHVVIYTDGACSGNPGPGGWGLLLARKETARCISGFSPWTTNNQMELFAAITALRTLTKSSTAELHTDSRYVHDGITKWVFAWQESGWLTADKKPVKNEELWRNLYLLTQQHSVIWKWVRGHSTDPLNGFVDQLATSAIVNQAGVDETMTLREFEERLLYQPVSAGRRRGR